MSNHDLDTLLRAGGRGPTTDVDVDLVHTRGRRRAVIRRTTIVVGALGLLGVVAAALGSLPAAQPDIGPIDEVPTEADGGVARTLAQLPRVSEAELAAELGLTVLRIDAPSGPVTERDEPIGMTATSPDGEVVTDAWAAGQLGPAPLGVATADGTVWGVDLDGNLVGRNPLTGTEHHVIGPGHPWVPRGTTSEGELLVATSAQAMDEAGTPLQVGLLRSGAELVEPVLGTDAAGAIGPGTLLAAAATSEVFVLASVEQTADPTVAPTRIHLLPDGGEPVLLYETDVNGRLVFDVEVVDGEVWALEFVDSDTIVRRFSLEGEDLGRVEEGSDLAFGAVADLSASPDGSTVVLSMGPGESPGGAIVVDVAAIRAGASLDDAARVLELAGTIHLVRTPPVTCSSSGSTQGMNAAPEHNGQHVWFACLADGGSLDPFPFFRVDPAPEDAEGIELLRRLVTQYLAGPSPADGDRGVDPLAPPGSVELVDVEADGRRVTITVASTAETGVPTGSTDGWAFRVALAALGVQFDAYDEAVVVTDGVCGDWEGTTDPSAANDCIVWTETHMPWNQ